MSSRRSSNHSSGGSRDSSPASEQQSRSKAGVRVSLACVPCRSKHIKCDATTPACLRCQLEQKPCFYAKSRRGIRDPRKRSMMCDRQPQPDPTEGLWPLTQMSAFHLPIRFLNDMPAGWSLAKKISPNPSTSAATALLLDRFYTDLYSIFPWVLPKQYMMSRMATTPADLQFLISTFTYVASLYDATISSDELRESAYSQACGPLPMTPHTVQGLLIISVAALGEDKHDLCAGWLDRAIQIALDIGMQHKSFADAESDPVVAESYRRTYWASYILDCHRAVRDNLPAFSLYGRPATAEIPCEEWEYQSGTIPTPLSFAKYDNRDPVEEPVFSSWTYTLDLFRLIGEVVLPLKLYHDQPWQDDLNRAEIRITNWLVRIPKWKQEAVDPNGTPDMMLHLSITMAYGMRIRLRQPFNRLQLGVKEGFAIGPLERPQTAINPKLNASWQVCPKELAAANDLCSYHTVGLSPCFFNPLAMIGVERICVALLDGCVFLGCDTPAVREKLSLVFGLMKKYAEIWPLGLKKVRALKEVAANCLGPPPPPTMTNGAASRGVATSPNIVLGGEPLWQESVYPSRPISVASQHHHHHHHHDAHTQTHQPGPSLIAAAGAFYPEFQGNINPEAFDEWLVGQ